MNDGFWVSSTEIRGGIPREDVRTFRDYVQPGDKLTCYTGIPTEKRQEGYIEQESRCKVLRKYPHVVLTSKGCFQWTLLTIWNKDILREAQKFGASLSELRRR